MNENELDRVIIIDGKPSPTALEVVAHPDDYPPAMYERARDVIADMVIALEAAGIDYDADTTAEKEIAAAWKRGDLTEGHDAILKYGDMVKYCNITEATL